MSLKSEKEKALFEKTAQFREQYKGKKEIPLNEVVRLRDEIVKIYGRKIVSRAPEELTDEERVWQMTYKSLTDTINEFAPPSFKILDWLVETTNGQIVTYSGAAVISFVIGLFFWNSSLIVFFLLFILVALFNFLKALTIILRVVLKNSKEWWKSTEP